MKNKLLPTLVKEARELMNAGVYDPEELFNIVYRKHRVHYSTVRTAVHIAKTSCITYKEAS